MNMARFDITERRVQAGLFALAALMGGVFMITGPGLEAQLAVLGALVVVAGLPHGGLDTVIARRMGWLSSWRVSVAFHLAYLALAGLVVGLWLIAPGFSLLVFLLISAWHFGGDWRLGGSAPLRFLAGLGVLSLPAFSDLQTVAALYGFLAPDWGAQLASWQGLMAPAVLVSLLLLAGFSAYSRQWSDAAELALLAVAGILLPPLIFFAAYFCALHSPRNLLAEWVKIDAPALRKLASTAFYSMAAAAGMGALLWIGLQPGWQLSLEEVLVRVLFIGLAALTVPHMALAFAVQRAERR